MSAEQTSPFYFLFGDRRDRRDRRQVDKAPNVDRRELSRRLVGVNFNVDPWLAGAAVLLLVLGFVMVSSASIHVAYKQTNELNPWFFSTRQAVYIVLGFAAAMVVLRVRMARWEYWGPYIMLGGLALLILVLIPGIGREVNGATRWINLVFFNLQVSELVKLGVVIYVAGYLVRRGNEVRSSIRGFLKPMLVVALIAGLLLAEPDFGATVVIGTTVLGMMFLGGVRLWQFGVSAALVAGVFATLAITSPYRLARLTSFLDPWAEDVVRGSGYQLTQSLIAIGRGDVWGVGLGESVQKLQYLPEAHTDFLFAILTEETGLVGALVVIALFITIVVRAFVIGLQAERVGAQFSAYIAFGLGLWIGVQAFFNIGVNLGALPTKGLTLPLMSYGGSSMVVTCIAIALLLRVDMEVRHLSRQAEREKAK